MAGIVYWIGLFEAGCIVGHESAMLIFSKALKISSRPNCMLVSREKMYHRILGAMHAGHHEKFTFRIYNWQRREQEERCIGLLS